MNIIEKKLESSAIKFSLVDKEKEIGRAYLYLIYNDIHEAPLGYLEDLFVDEAYRGDGLGTELLHTVMEKAKEIGCYKLVGTSRMSKKHVHAWYEKNGLQKHGYSFRIDF